MNAAQRKILKAAASCIAIAALFPPFIGPAPYGSIRGIGYGFILSWPDGGAVHVALLVAEWVAICLIGGALTILAHQPGEASILTSIIKVANARNDAIIEAARIKADAIMRAAGK